MTLRRRSMQQCHSATVNSVTFSFTFDFVEFLLARHSSLQSKAAEPSANK